MNTEEKKLEDSEPYKFSLESMSSVLAGKQSEKKRGKGSIIYTGTGGNSRGSHQDFRVMKKRSSMNIEEGDVMNAIKAADENKYLKNVFQGFLISLNKNLQLGNRLEDDEDTSDDDENDYSQN